MRLLLPSLALAGVVSAKIYNTGPSVPSPGAKCGGEVAYCAGLNTNIILRCADGKIVPGNCNDNTGEPSQGALCNSYAANTATCSIIGSTPTSAHVLVTASASASIATATHNATVTMATHTPPPPIQTGAATAKSLSWSDAILALFIAGAGLVL